MIPFLTSQQKAMILSYVRSSVVALAALTTTGEPTWTNFGKALIVAFLAPALRWADKSDTAFGRGS
jgi:hypothetical protein